MFEQARLTQRSRGPLSLLIGGALTLLGYYGVPWWAGWPASAVLASGESAWALSQRSVTWQVAVFAAAVLVNVLCWALLVRLLLWATAPRRPSASTGGRRPPDRSRL